MNAQWLTAIASSTMVVAVTACGDDGSACLDGDCSAGGGSVTAGGAGGSGGEPAGGNGGADVGGGGAGTGGQGGMGPAMVHVVVADLDDVPAIAFNVISNDVDGGLVGQALTDVDGTADLEVPPNGSLTLVFATPLDEGGIYQNVETMFFDGAPPEDVRFFSFDATTPVTTDPMSLVVSYSPKAGASSYRIIPICGASNTVSGGTSISTTVQDCAADGHYEGIVLALDSGGTIVDYQSVEGDDFVEGGTVTHAISWPSAGLAETSVSLSNIPTGSLGVDLFGADLLEHHRNTAGLGGSQHFRSLETPSRPPSCTIQAGMASTATSSLSATRWTLPRSQCHAGNVILLSRRASPGTCPGSRDIKSTRLRMRRSKSGGRKCGTAWSAMSFGSRSTQMMARM